MHATNKRKINKSERLTILVGGVGGGNIGTGAAGVLLGSAGVLSLLDVSRD